jgi:hypothetical protein
MQIEIDVLDTIREIKVRAANEKGIKIPAIYQKELEKLQAKYNDQVEMKSQFLP